MRRYRWLIVLGLVLIAAWVLNVSRPGRRPEGCPTGCATATVRLDGPLRVMSLNMLHGFPRFEHLEQRLDIIAAEIRRQDPDLVLLQEVPWHRGNAAQWLAEQVGLNYLYLRANGNRWALLFEEGEVILSRFPLLDATWAELAPRAGFFEHRVVLGATAVTPWGDLPVFTTHLTHGDAGTNRHQAAALKAFVDGAGNGLALVGGDFNAVEGSPQIQSLRWVDTYRRAHPGEEGFTCCVDDLGAGPAELLEKRIDYLFLVPGSGPAKVVASQRILDQPLEVEPGWLWASDHAGLLTEISLEP
ncbi:MAG: endonuclease/exonuclease/phosphatase family protein [Anaerolineae bacterium]|nr:endonuclease/exonuclease/phosphatase family protein [Anaerolineae bacterium]